MVWKPIMDLEFDSMKAFEKTDNSQIPGRRLLFLSSGKEVAEQGGCKMRIMRRPKSSFCYVFGFIIILLVLNGCASYSRIHNTYSPETYQKNEYFNNKFNKPSNPGDTFLALSFSGGGTRAAAFSYGVLQELRDTFIRRENGQVVRLLDEVDHISGVSGGSFTAAYYGLFKDRIFDDYETVFLRRNVQKTLINSIFNPVNWFRSLFSGFDRGALAIDYYDKQIFQEKTFGDMAATPYIQINATDLGTGQAFGFTHESFAVLCSNLDDFKVARAVAASSAVPVAFTPVTLQNYPGCDISAIHNSLLTVKGGYKEDIRTKKLLYDASALFDKEQRQFIHLVDGGISDNLGIRPMINRIILLEDLHKKRGDDSAFHMPENFVMIVVNAQVSPERAMEKSPDAPSSVEVMGAVSSAQIQRYNLETIARSKKLFESVAQTFAKQGQTVNTYFIELKFNDILDLTMRTIFNNMATSFSLPDEQVDLLVESGKQLLRESPEFQRFLHALQGIVNVPDVLSAPHEK